MSDVIHVECRSCGTSVPAADINIEKLVAKCSRCHAVFGIHLDGSASAPRGGVKIAPPKNVTVENQGGEFVILRRWRGWGAVIFLTIFAMIWNGICWPFFVAMLMEGPWFIAAFLSIFCLVGLAVAYSTLAMLLNSTEIRVGSRDLAVKHGPVPVPGGVEVQSGDIEQLWVEQSISHSRSNNGHVNTHVTYSVLLRKKDGTREVLLKSAGSSEFALFVEQEIEEHLGIENRPVRGEFR